jgi:hypothetical protein
MVIFNTWNRACGLMKTFKIQTDEITYHVTIMYQHRCY